MFGRLLRSNQDPFTTYCRRITLRTIVDTARLDNEAARSFLVKLSSEPKWHESIQNTSHPKVSLLLCLLILSASADFVRKSKQNKTPQNPINSINSDVAMIETSIFFWYALASTIASGAENGAFGALDRDACVHAGTILCQVIQATTRRPIAEGFRARLGNYRKAESSALNQAFFETLLRSVGKRMIDEPDHGVDLTVNHSGISDINAHMAAMLPVYLRLYRELTDKPSDAST